MRMMRGAVLMMATALLVMAGCGDDDDDLRFVPPPSDPIAQLPVTQTIQAPGLAAQADAVVDDLGVPHIYASDIESAVYVQGYLVAASRFWEMDMFRRFAEGRLSEVLGRATTTTDIEMRTVFTTRDGRRLIDVLWEYVQATDPEVTRIAHAYAAGVNAWLADMRAGRNGATFPPEYQLGVLIDLRPEDLEDWHPRDTAAIGRLQAWLLSESLSEEVDAARLIATLPEALVKDVWRSAPAAPATVLPPPPRARRVGGAAAASVPPLPSVRVLDEIHDALAEVRRMSPLGTRDDGLGSNNWIVSPALSANGHAMLANDPHLQLLNPPIWFVNHIDAGPDNRVNGVIFPGLPGVILGSTETGAWGGTVAYFDVTDVYMETVTTPPDYPASPRTVLFKGQQVPLIRVEETIKVKRNPSIDDGHRGRSASRADGAGPQPARQRCRHRRDEHELSLDRARDQQRLALPARHEPRQQCCGVPRRHPQFRGGRAELGVGRRRGQHCVFPARADSAAAGGYHSVSADVGYG